MIVQGDNSVKSVLSSSSGSEFFPDKADPFSKRLGVH